MSTLFWKILRLSPVLLGASLFFSGSAYAQENASEQTVGNSTEVTMASSTELPQTPVMASRTITPQTVSDPTVASGTDQVALPESTVEASTQLPEITQSQPSFSPLTPTDSSANLNPNLNRADSILAQQVPAAENSSNEVLQQIQQYQENNGEIGVDALDQVTNVTQLSDVRPTDWAYEALRSLVERYGCIAGYPDGTFRGNRAMTRYEFAAGLNACLQQIERIFKGGGNEFATRADLETLQRLVDEFRTELTALGGRVDQLEGRVAFLEDHQFSTTTKLRGEAIFALADVFGEERAVNSSQVQTNQDLDLNPILANRVRLAFESSFTGKDRLRTRIQARNITSFNSDLTGTNMTRLSFDGDNGNNVELDELWYRFPLSNKLTVQIDAFNGEFQDTVINTVNPYFASSGSGAISRFGRFNPIYRIGSGAGAAATYKLSNSLALSAAYFANEANNPLEKRGLFDGNYSALAQLTYNAGNFATLGLTYARSYYRGGNVNATGSIGSEFARRPFGNNVATSTNSYGVQGNLKFGPLSVGGWVGYQDAEAESTGIAGADAESWNWAANAAITDFGSKGSTLGVVFGMPPRARGNDVVARRDLDTSYHLEAFYRFKLNNNIAITPGMFVIFNPEHNNANENIYVGTIRTTFTF